VSKPAAGGLSIGGVAANTGLSPEVIRAWEVRYGFPTPERTATGQRRYSPEQIAQLADVLQHRQRGLSVPAAIAAARRLGGERATTVFAAIRQHHPALAVHRLGRAAMLAVSRAIEDEACRGGGRPVVIGSFQTRGRFHAVEARWQDLARTAAVTIAVADFGRSVETRRDIVRVPLPPGDPRHREWAVVCDGVDTPVCLAGWEVPPGSPARGTTFESIWTMDPAAVRAASRRALALVAHSAPDAAAAATAALGDDLVAGPGPHHLDQVTALTNRIVAYVAAAR
jgi:DNA-binding transcriptional MerR regulator